MKRLEIKYNTSMVERDSGNIDIEATLQSIIDRVNEHTEKLNEMTAGVGVEATYVTGGVPPKRFKAYDLAIAQWTNGVYLIEGFKSEAEAQAALELLLNF